MLVVVAWFGGDASFGQSIYSGLRVPAQVLKGAATDQQMFAAPGYVPSGTQADPLSNYQRSRLGRWDVAKEIDSADSVFGIELDTPVGPIRIRFETTISGQPFRAAREKTIDELLAIAKGDLKSDLVTPTEEGTTEETKTEEKSTKEISKEETQVSADAIESDAESVSTQTYVASSVKDRMIAYVRARGDRLTRHELRRRVADIAGGPSLLRTRSDYGSQRHETVTLFAFLDADEDGVISPQESSVAIQALNDRDVNSDGKTDWNELQLGLKLRTAQRKTGAVVASWQPWDANEPKAIEDLRVAVSFGNNGKDSALTIGEGNLDEQWEVETAEVRRAFAKSTHGSIVLASHPKFSVALSAAQSSSSANGETEQISIGVALGSNALFRRLDQDGDWSLSTAERQSCSEVIASLDANADGALATSELPVLLRVCVSFGATAHEALADNVSIVRKSDEEKESSHQTAPTWFTSMDGDGSRTLTRKEFLGKRKSFDNIDTDQNNLLSVAEVLAAESD